MAMTPRSRVAAGSDASLLNAPRSLNELVTWRFSYLTKMSAAVSAESLGAGSMGVRNTWPAMVRRAASMSAIVMLMAHLLATLAALAALAAAGAARLGPARGESALNHGALDRIPDTRLHFSFIPQMAVHLAQRPSMLWPLMESSIARINSEDIWS